MSALVVTVFPFQVYVVPELGSQDLSAIVKQEVENVCELERQKVQQVLSNLSSVVQPSENRVTENRDGENPDSPSSFTESSRNIAPLVVNSLSSIQDTPLTVTSTLVPSSSIGVSTMIENNNHIIAEEQYQSITSAVRGEVQGLVRVAGLVCVECGVEALSPFQCGPCGALVCSQVHLDVHVASNHRVMFQCSVCGLHYVSQAECVAHVTAAHSSHLQAVQTGASTYLAPLTADSLRVNTGDSVPQQFSLPLIHTQPGSHCLVQVGPSTQQLPLVISPSTPVHQPGASDIIQTCARNLTDQAGSANIINQAGTSGVIQVAANGNHQTESSSAFQVRSSNTVNQAGSNVILHYTDPAALPGSLLPHLASVNTAEIQERQTVFAEADLLSSTEQTEFKDQEKLSHNTGKQKKLVHQSLCTITLPSNPDESLLLPSDEGSVGSLAVDQNVATVSTVLSHQNNSSNSEDNSSSLLNNSENSTQQGEAAPVLLVDSLPLTDVSSGSTVMPKHEVSFCYSTVPVLHLKL